MGAGQWVEVAIYLAILVTLNAAVAVPLGRWLGRIRLELHGLRAPVLPQGRLPSP